MKKFLILALSLILSFILGVIEEWLSFDMLIHAKETLNGKPLPDMTQWVYGLGQCSGGILCVFLIPWALFLFLSFLAPSDSRSDRDLRLVCGFMFYSVLEAILFVFFTFACLLPFIPHYITPLKSPGNSAAFPLIAYLPQIMLIIVFVSAVVLAVRNVAHRFQKATDVSPE